MLSVLKYIIVWSIISCSCIVAIITFAKRFIQDVSNGKDLFIPGILVLVGAVLLLFIFGITRVIKYIKLCSARGNKNEYVNLLFCGTQSSLARRRKRQNICNDKGIL